LWDSRLYRQPFLYIGSSEQKTKRRAAFGRKATQRSLTVYSKETAKQFLITYKSKKIMKTFRKILFFTVIFLFFTVTLFTPLTTYSCCGGNSEPDNIS